MQNEKYDHELAIKRWLKKRSLYRTLKWCDAHETVEVFFENVKRKWDTEVIECDRIFNFTWRYIEIE